MLFVQLIRYVWYWTLYWSRTHTQCTAISLLLNFTNRFKNDFCIVFISDNFPYFNSTFKVQNDSSIFRYLIYPIDLYNCTKSFEIKHRTLKRTKSFEIPQWQISFYMRRCMKRKCIAFVDESLTEAWHEHELPYSFR